VTFMNLNCFACGRKILENPYEADTRDDQFVWVGPECFKHIRAAGDAGWQPPRRPHGPRLYPMPKETPDA